MVHRGCVLENNIDHIIVITKSSQYMKLRKKGDISIGKEILFLEEDIIKDSRTIPKGINTIAAAILLLVLSTALIFQFGFDFLGSYQTYAIVSLDINPSLQFEVNKKEIVKKVKALNEEGERIIDNNIIEGMRIEEAISFIIEEAVEKNYINQENNLVLIADAIKRDVEDSTIKIKEDIEKWIRENEKLQNIEVIYISSNNKSIESAEENNVTIGKYEIYETVTKIKPDIKIEDIRDNKLNEIIKENKDVVKGENIKLIKFKSNNKDMNRNEVDLNLDNIVQEKKGNSEKEEKIEENKGNNRDKEDANNQNKENIKKDNEKKENNNGSNNNKNNNAKEENINAKEEKNTDKANEKESNKNVEKPKENGKPKVEEEQEKNKSSHIEKEMNEKENLSEEGKKNIPSNKKGNTNGQGNIEEENMEENKEEKNNSQEKDDSQGKDNSQGKDSSKGKDTSEERESKEKSEEKQSQGKENAENSSRENRDSKSTNGKSNSNNRGSQKRDNKD